MEIGLEDILAFVAVAEHGSVSAAAERLGLAQPVVTRRIQRLEAALRVDLLDRRVRPAQLTAAGQQALGPCRSMLGALTDLRTIIQDATPSGELRFGVAPALADLALAAALGDLHTHYPRVTLRVQTDWTPQLLHQLRVGVLDLAVVQLPVDAPAPSGLASRAVGIEPLVVVAAPEQGLGAHADLSTLGQFPWVLSLPGDGGRMLLESVLRRYDIPLQIAAEIQGYDHQIALVARGLGLGLLPARLINHDPARLPLQPVHLSDEALTMQIWTARVQAPAPLAAPLTLLEDALAQAIVQGLRPRPGVIRDV